MDSQSIRAKTLENFCLWLEKITQNVFCDSFKENVEVNFSPYSVKFEEKHPGKVPEPIEQNIERSLKGLRSAAPDAKFNNKGVAELVPDGEKSLATSPDLLGTENLLTAQIARREAEAAKSLKFIERIAAGIIVHDDHGDDSGLYGAFVFVRRSRRRSGLTPRVKASGTTRP